MSRYARERWHQDIDPVISWVGWVDSWHFAFGEIWMYNLHLVYYTAFWLYNHPSRVLGGEISA